MPELSQSFLKDIMSYDRETGIFIWLKPTKFHPRMIGKQAGSPSAGYILIKIDGRKYDAHRLAWLYEFGEMPNSAIDHKDGDPSNNRIDNLRLCTTAQNIANAKVKKGKALPKGVRATRSKYTARISYEGKLMHIGTYETIEKAEAAYMEKAIKLYGEFARSSWA